MYILNTGIFLGSVEDFETPVEALIRSQRRS